MVQRQLKQSYKDKSQESGVTMLVCQYIVSCLEERNAVSYHIIQNWLNAQNTVSCP